MRLCFYGSYSCVPGGKHGVPILLQHCGCYRVGVGRYLMLCHIQYIHSLAWIGQWPCIASGECLCPRPTSSVRPLGWGWGPPCCLQCFLKERCESHQSLRNFVDSSTGRGVLPILIFGGRWTLVRGAVKCMTLHLWAANLKPFSVAHPCMALTACCKCLSMVSRERPQNQIARSSTKSALKISLAIRGGSSLIFSPKHATSNTSPVGTPSFG